MGLKSRLNLKKDAVPSVNVPDIDKDNGSNDKCQPCVSPKSTKSKSRPKAEPATCASPPTATCTATFTSTRLRHPDTASGHGIRTRQKSRPIIISVGVHLHAATDTASGIRLRTRQFRPLHVAIFAVAVYGCRNGNPRNDVILWEGLPVRVERWQSTLFR